MPDKRQGCVIGVDLGATNIKIGFIENNKILLRKILPTKDYPLRNELIFALVSAIKDVIALARSTAVSAKARYARILGVGFGLPGPVDYLRGIVHYFPNIAGWRNVAFRKIMHKRLGLPVFIDNDANLMCLAESRVGAARGRKNVIALTLGTGIGGGILINGNLYRGASFAAGELGHIPINENGPRCNCGGVACLERYIGNRYILEHARKAFKRNIPLEELSRLARMGNVKAVSIWRETAVRLGVALAGVVNLFNPEVIVIGGGVSEAGNIIFDNVRKTIKARAMPVQAQTVRVIKAGLGSDAGMIGAGLLASEGFAAV